MATTLEVMAPGAYASVQDLGRRGLRRVGVPWAGVLDPRLMRVANALVGNRPDAPVIECFDGGLQLAARHGPVRVAVAGHVVLERISWAERRVLAPWSSLVLADGDVLRLRQMSHGRLAVVAIEGIALPQVLGSASTYARAGLGGVNGRALATGMHLPAGAATERQEHMLPPPPSGNAEPIRVVMGPQDDHFSDDALTTLLNTPYRVTPEADRMGVRLEGPALAHRGVREIVSDATAPGSIQVPGNGQPIVLLADAQTAGGYPKIATVIGCDLPRVAALKPGHTLRFQAVTASQGVELARATEATTREWLARILPLLPGGIDENALYASNLVTGFIDAQSAEHRLYPLPTQA